MWQEERLQRIKAMVATFQRVNAERVAEELGVSRETVRRDLLTLEDEGVLKRVHGGAVAVEGTAEPPFAQRAATQVREKRAIAKAAARLIEPGQTVFLDAGSTTSILAADLATLSGLTVLTNSVEVATAMVGDREMESRANTVVLIGGRMAREPLATRGSETIGEIHRYRADLALLSPVGIDARYGATSFDAEEAEIARAMARNAQRTCILADHSKWGVVSRVSYRAPDGIDILVGDPKARQSPAYDALRAQVGQIVTA